MNTTLKREDWNFSSLPPDELIPALLWEMRREHDDLDQICATAQAWLDGKLSEKKPPMPKDKRTGKRPRYNSNSSEADEARIRATTVFQEFIPFHEFLWLHKKSMKQRRVEYISWLAGHLATLVKHCHTPWLCLPETERQRFCKAYEDSETAQVVTIGTWWDAVAYFKQHKLDSDLPLKFDFTHYTSVLLTINWGYSRKRILTEIAKLLKHFEPVGTKLWDGRGKKDRDILVVLERLAIMRLLHHHTLAEIRRLVPDAWTLYGNRKWYNDRRQALKDFRSIISHREIEKFFPKSWETKARRSQKALRLPAK
jgi:hypothetical protein